MKTVHLIYSTPDFDSRDCDRRLPGLRVFHLERIPYRLAECAELLAGGDDPPEFAEVESLEIWRNGQRIDVIYPTPEESFT